MSPMQHFQNLSFVTIEKKIDLKKRKFCLTSVGWNSTRQPILLFTGGGLNLIDCQFVELIFYKYEKYIKTKWTKLFTSKWSVSFVSSRWSFSSNKITVSRINKCAICCANKSSIPIEQEEIHMTTKILRLMYHFL